MVHSWKKLLSLTGGNLFRIKQIFIPSENISVEGDFELPPLARLSGEDQLFVSAFIQTHGSIKQMEKIFRISYPTVKNRLNKIASQLDMVNIVTEEEPDSSEILERLSRGDISVDQAIEEIKK